MVKWKNPYPQLQSINSGPVFFSITSGHEKTHLVDPNTKAQREVSFPLGLGASGFGNQTICMLGESSKPPMESSMPSTMPEAPTVGGSSFSSADQALEIPTPILLQVNGYPVAGNASPSFGSSNAVVLASIKDGFSMGSASGAETTLGLGKRVSGSTGAMVGSSVLAEIMVQNHFSPLSDLGNGVEDEFMAGEDLVKDQRWQHHAHRSRQRSVGSVGDF